MKIKFENLEGDAPKLIFWREANELFVPESTVESKEHSKKIVFTQAAMHHPVYAYSAYLAVLSLYACSDLDKYDIRVYCTDNLTDTLNELFHNFPKVKVLRYDPIGVVRPDWITEEQDYNTCVKTQFWWDRELWNYDVVCGLDADLFGVGEGGTFSQLEQLKDGILLCPTGDPWEIFTSMMNDLNRNPKGDVIGRLEREYEIYDLEDKIKSLPWWGNSSLHAMPTKYLSESSYNFVNLLDFWFKEPCYCDESFLTIFSIWNNIGITDVNDHLVSTKHYLEHHSVFNDKTMPMHKVNYEHNSAITHRLSTTKSAQQLVPRFQEFLEYTKYNFLKKYTS